MRKGTFPVSVRELRPPAFPASIEKPQPIMPNSSLSSLIVVNGEPGNPRLRRLSNRVKPRQNTFHDTGATIWISGGSSGPSMAFSHLSRQLVAPEQCEGGSEATADQSHSR
jgi:hypothetical protein